MKSNKYNLVIFVVLFSACSRSLVINGLVESEHFLNSEGEIELLVHQGLGMGEKYYFKIKDDMTFVGKIKIERNKELDIRAIGLRNKKIMSVIGGSFIFNNNEISEDYIDLGKIYFYDYPEMKISKNEDSIYIEIANFNETMYQYSINIYLPVSKGLKKINIADKIDKPIYILNMNYLKEIILKYNIDISMNNVIGITVSKYKIDKIEKTEIAESLLNLISVY